MQFNIALLPGDGVGPEVIAEGVKVLNRVEVLTEVTFNLEYGLVEEPRTRGAEDHRRNRESEGTNTETLKRRSVNTFATNC